MLGSVLAPIAIGILGPMPSEITLRAVPPPPARPRNSNVELKYPSKVFPQIISTATNRTKANRAIPAKINHKVRVLAETSSLRASLITGSIGPDSRASVTTVCGFGVD